MRSLMHSFTLLSVYGPEWSIRGTRCQSALILACSNLDLL